MQHSYGYEIGDTVWVFSGRQDEHAISYKAESITPTGKMRLKNAAGAIEWVNKYGTITGYGNDWFKPRIVRKENQSAKIAEVKYRYAFKQWQYELKNLTDELLRNPVMETVERISAHINTKPQDPTNERPATEA